MKHYTSLLFLFMLSISGISTVSAQAYTTAIGARLGDGIGLTMQQVIFPQWTLEGILARRQKERLTHYALILETHRKLIGKRLNFYLGAGIQGGSYDSELEEVLEPPLGMVGVVGLEITVKRLNISVDFQPELNFKGGPQLLTTSTAISLRYVVLKQIKKKKNKKGKRNGKRKSNGKKNKKGDFNWKFWENWGNKSKKSQIEVSNWQDDYI